METLETYTRIVTRPRCKGEGCTGKWNDREREYDRVTCSACGGARVLRKIVRIEYEKVGNEVDKRDN